MKLPLITLSETVRRGATPLIQQPDRARRRHLWVIFCATAGVALIAMAISGPQEAATLSPGSASAVSDPEPVILAAAGSANPAPGVTESKAPPPPALEPQWHEETVRSGDNLSLIFARAGYSDRDVYEVTRADGGKALRRIYPGETVAFRTDTGDRLAAVRHTESRLKSTLFVRGDKGFATEVVERSPELRERGIRLQITSSLFLAGTDAGLSNRVIMDLAGIFGGVIDFVLDPRVGDTIELIFEEKYLDGEKLGDGDIVAAAFSNKGDRFEAYRYTDSAGDTSYYNEDGVSMRKAFLMAPVDFTRISSNFNPNRLHPVYKTRRPHRGTDYAAPRGTPVFAAGDGRVVEAGYTRANGNYVFIQHGESYKTHYLHLTKRNVKRGDRVSQGAVIGTVGSTGAATGPHLHYEFLVHGVHRNPRSVHKLLPKAKALPDAELPSFRSRIAPFGQQLAALRPDTQLALKD